MSSSKTKIFFRADGNGQIGFGHVIRSLALVDMINTQFDCTFFCINPSEYVKKEIITYCKELNVIESESIFINQIKNGQIVVIDGYQYTSDYMQKIVDRGAKLVYIDDMHNQFYPAHLIINHSPSAKAIQYNKAEYTKLLLGFDYALLRRPFRESAKSMRANSQTKKLLICMGGADPHKLTDIILEASVESHTFQEINVIRGIKNKKTGFNNSDNIKFHSNLGAKDMNSLMMENDLIVAPASSVCMEAIATGMNIICGYSETNQKELYDYLNQNKIVHGLDKLTDLNKNDFILAFQKCSSFFNQTPVHKKIIDGNQEQRFIQAFEDLTKLN